MEYVGSDERERLLDFESKAMFGITIRVANSDAYIEQWLSRDLDGNGIIGQLNIVDDFMGYEIVRRNDQTKLETRASYLSF